MFHFPVRVYYEDTDAGGITYYANYLKFCERARTEWLRQLGFGQQALATDAGVIFVVRRVEIDYIQSARLDDELSVSVTVAKLGRVSIEFIQEISRDGMVLARSRTKVGCINASSFKPAELPQAIAQAADRQMQVSEQTPSGLK